VLLGIAEIEKGERTFSGKSIEKRILEHLEQEKGGGRW
jgi:hypothetical protein